MADRGVDLEQVVRGKRRNLAYAVLGDEGEPRLCRGDPLAEPAAPLEARRRRRRDASVLAPVVDPERRPRERDDEQSKRGAGRRQARSELT
jgi:hypothetical protein